MFDFKGIGIHVRELKKGDYRVNHGTIIYIKEYSNGFAVAHSGYLSEGQKDAMIFIQKSRSVVIKPRK